MEDLPLLFEKPGSRLPRREAGTDAAPATLAEFADALTLNRDGNLLKTFLRVFHADPDPGRLAREPRLLQAAFGDGGVADAWLAAVADHLCREQQWPTPSWTVSSERIAQQPWFESDVPALRTALLQESPTAFRERNLFTASNACSSTHPAALPC